LIILIILGEEYKKRNIIVATCHSNAWSMNMALKMHMFVD
jgi:hypothetical protein